MSKIIPDVKGMSKEQAISVLKSSGFNPRVSKEDGKYLCYSLIYVPDLIHINVDDGIVTDVYL